jgi:hypothetical protein
MRFDCQASIVSYTGCLVHDAVFQVRMGDCCYFVLWHFGETIFFVRFGSANLNALEPEAYLHHVPTHIADHPINRVNELATWNVVMRTTLAPRVSSASGHQALQ